MRVRNAKNYRTPRVCLWQGRPRGLPLSRVRRTLSIPSVENVFWTWPSQEEESKRWTMGGPTCPWEPVATSSRRPRTPQFHTLRIFFVLFFFIDFILSLSLCSSSFLSLSFLPFFATRPSDFFFFDWSHVFLEISETPSSTSHPKMLEISRDSWGQIKCHDENEF